MRFSYPASRGDSISPDSYLAWYDASDKPAPFRVLVTEWDSNDYSAALLNAAWVNVPELVTGPIDIVFPTPARKLSKTERSLQLPTTGAVIGPEVLSERKFGRVWRSENSYPYPVGRSWVDPTPDTATWVIEALAGDMAPTEANVELTSARDGDVSKSILVAVDPLEKQPVTVPPAERLEATGESLGTLSIVWSAPGYSHVGASIVAWTGSGAWYLYSFGGSVPPAQRWPRLPTGVSREEVGLGSDDFLINVFSTTQKGVPWDWDGKQAQKAVGISSRLPPGSSDQFETRADTGPLNAYDGIYLLTDVIWNSWSCSEEEGTSVREGFMHKFFVVVGF